MANTVLVVDQIRLAAVAQRFIPSHGALQHGVADRRHSAGVKVAGTLSVLDEADHAGFVVFDNAIAELLKTSFGVSQAVLSEIREKRSSS